MAAALVLATLSSTIESNQWWVRIWDFPRVQLLVALVIVGLLAAWRDRAFGRWLAAGCLLAAGWQMWRIYPYTPVARAEVAIGAHADIPADRCFSLLSFNVYQDNRDFKRTAALIDRVDPDILLLMETDLPWTQAMAPQLARYPHRLLAPTDNTYGMILATRLPMTGGRTEIIAEPDTPSMHGTLTAGLPFRLIALHPRPPHPGQDTEERDAEIAIAARRAARERLPVLAIGDFNDVAWSHTSQLFKRIGGYLDPRIGRGPFATFPADYPFLRWPLDHIFITPEFAVRSMAVLENVGSDHLPVHAELCITPGNTGNAAPEAVTREDRRDTQEVLDDYAVDTREEAQD
ncbi:endonuclease/exonuclease/phosphatase family protein [Sphingomonas baiyangensis]|uniref:endonuclease/exonuclease/phosphatase family protein n=1 Tax=Sphingomonas baiyangensis TaxID=2572576 RepID=UPI0010AEABE5|nr:endonuclease/exonuclease/phosphatase family protein [Sphingomonas baiyangensis]